ncbi:MAG: hypothetical protein ACLUQ6_09370 [Alistipes onderdonkii]
MKPTAIHRLSRSRWNFAVRLQSAAIAETQIDADIVAGRSRFESRAQRQYRHHEAVRAA